MAGRISWHGQTTWMQTTGATLLAGKRCSVVHAWMAAEDSRSALRLLYLAAVRRDGRKQECCQGYVDIGSASLAAPEAVGAQHRQLHTHNTKGDSARSTSIRFRHCWICGRIMAVADLALICRDVRAMVGRGDSGAGRACGVHELCPVR
jgi:hypothetical protein